MTPIYLTYNGTNLNVHRPARTNRVDSLYLALLKRKVGGLLLYFGMLGIGSR